jgi:hypothetical protein
LLALGMYARRKLGGLPPVPRESGKSRSLRAFFKQPRILRKVARWRSLAQWTSEI